MKLSPLITLTIGSSLALISCQPPMDDTVTHEYQKALQEIGTLKANISTVEQRNVALERDNEKLEKELAEASATQNQSDDIVPSNLEMVIKEQAEVIEKDGYQITQVTVKMATEFGRAYTEQGMKSQCIYSVVKLNQSHEFVYQISSSEDNYFLSLMADAREKPVMQQAPAQQPQKTTIQLVPSGASQPAQPQRVRPQAPAQQPTKTTIQLVNPNGGGNVPNFPMGQ